VIERNTPKARGLFCINAAANACHRCRVAKPDKIQFRRLAAGQTKLVVFFGRQIHKRSNPSTPAFFGRASRKVSTPLEIRSGVIPHQNDRVVSNRVRGKQPASASVFIQCHPALQGRVACQLNGGTTAIGSVKGRPSFDESNAAPGRTGATKKKFSSEMYQSLGSPAHHIGNKRPFLPDFRSAKICVRYVSMKGGLFYVPCCNAEYIGGKSTPPPTPRVAWGFF